MLAAIVFFLTNHPAGDSATYGFTDDNPFFDQEDYNFYLWNEDTSPPDQLMVVSFTDQVCARACDLYHV